MKRLQLDAAELDQQQLENGGEYDPSVFDPLPLLPEKGPFRAPTFEGEDSQIFSSLIFGEELSQLPPRASVLEDINSPTSTPRSSRSSSSAEYTAYLDPVSVDSANKNGVASQQPPRFALDAEGESFDNKAQSPAGILQIVQQPPREVRTRKKKEKRSFTVKVRLVRSISEACSLVSRLVFADNHEPVLDEEECNRTTSIRSGGTQEEIAFQDLGIASPCLKYKDREFCIEIALLDGNSRVLDRVWTRRLYSYSNVGVLQRRREVEVVALSARYGTTDGGQRMHLVGKPFFKSDRLRVVFRIQRVDLKWTSVECSNVEFYSESVLFFTTPRIPRELLRDVANGRHAKRIIKLFVQVTNDGVNFSNGLEFLCRVTFPVQAVCGGEDFFSSQAIDEDLHQSRL